MLVHYMLSLLFLLLLAFIAWFWFDSAHAKEKAMIASATACQEIQAQLLDHTASLKSIKIARTSQGRMMFQRVYNFDFSHDHQQRSRGRVMMNGLKVQSIQLDNDQGTTIL